MALHPGGHIPGNKKLKKKKSKKVRNSKDKKVRKKKRKG